jgi:UDPglucose 6-dehydrogenase
MNIAIVGTGYVGLVSGTCFAEMGNDVTCIDIDKSKIDNLLAGQIPIYEPELSNIVKSNMEAGRLHFSTSLASVLDNVELVFSAVGTPSNEDGSADLSYVIDVAREFGRNIKKVLYLGNQEHSSCRNSGQSKAGDKRRTCQKGSRHTF